MVLSAMQCGSDYSVTAEIFSRSSSAQSLFVSGPVGTNDKNVRSKTVCAPGNGASSSTGGGVGVSE
jgi:hypothetical protein